MSVADTFEAFADRIEPHLNKGGASKPAASLLYQLLLKGSSSEKRFVFEEARQTLQVMAKSISPTLLVGHLLPYAEHKSPKVSYQLDDLLASSCGLHTWHLHLIWAPASEKPSEDLLSSCRVLLRGLHSYKSQCHTPVLRAACFVNALLFPQTSHFQSHRGPVTSHICDR